MTNPIATIMEIACSGDVQRFAIMGVEIDDPDFPSLRASFAYAVKNGRVVGQVGLGIALTTGNGPASDTFMGVREVRDLPLARWQRIARQTLIRGIATAGTESVGLPADVDEYAQRIVRRAFPDLDPTTGKGARRRWNRLIRLASAAEEHAQAVAIGDPSPAATVATRRGVAGSTVRSWCFQARQEGVTAAPLTTDREAAADA